MVVLTRAGEAIPEFLSPQKIAALMSLAPKLFQSIIRRESPIVFILYCLSTINYDVSTKLFPSCASFSAQDSYSVPVENVPQSPSYALPSTVSENSINPKVCCIFDLKSDAGEGGSG